MAKFLVTGGCGFIGSNLVEALLAGGHSVRVLDDLSTGKRWRISKEADFHIGSVIDPTIVDKSMTDVDGCFHLAAVSSIDKSIHDWVGTHRVNLTGMVNVLDRARNGSRSPIPVVFASSAAIYGDNSELPLSEQTVPKPLTPYGVDKLGCEQNARIAAQMHGIPTFGLRFFNVYGPWQDPESPYCGVIPIFARNLLNRTHVTVYGDGKQFRDFIYVGDAIRFLKRAMDRIDLNGYSVNACTGVQTSILDLVSSIGALTKITPVIKYAPAKKGEIRGSLGNSVYAQKILGIKAETDFATGIRNTVDRLRIPGSSGTLYR